MFARPNPAWYHRESPVDSALKLQFLGTAGFVVETGERTLVLDPYVSRPGIASSLFRRLRPDEDRIRRYIPRADDVLVGHAHHDHALDAPALCRQTGARLIGSSAACNLGRAAGLPESQLVCTAGRHDIPCGTVTVRGLPSLHGKAVLGRVPLPGDIPVPPPWPPRLWDLRHGLVLNWWLDAGKHRIVHVDSAEILEEELTGFEADILCLCAIGRAYRPNYVRDAVRLLKPRWILPCHWDVFTDPIEREARCLPGVDLGGFLGEIQQAGCEPVLLPVLGSWGPERPPVFRRRGREQPEAGASRTTAPAEVVGTTGGKAGAIQVDGPDK